MCTIGEKDYDFRKPVLHTPSAHTDAFLGLSSKGSLGREDLSLGLERPRQLSTPNYRGALAPLTEKLPERTTGFRKIERCVGKAGPGAGQTLFRLRLSQKRSDTVGDVGGTPLRAYILCFGHEPIGRERPGFRSAERLRQRYPNVFEADGLASPASSRAGSNAQGLTGFRSQGGRRLQGQRMRSGGSISTS
jgi:hypothetical protein